MKRLLILTLSFALVLFLAGCGQSGETPSDPWGLTLSVSDVTSTGLTYTFTQSGGSVAGTLTYGHEYWLEQETDEGWTKLEPVQTFPEFPELCCIQERGYTIEQVNWSQSYGEFIPGHYRIGKEVWAHSEPEGQSERVYYAEFDVE